MFKCRKCKLLQWNDIIIILGVETFLISAHSAKWQRVEQFVEPVVCRVVDVRVLTQVLTQRHRVGDLISAEVGRTVQSHQRDDAPLALHYDIVINCNFEFVHAVRAANKQTIHKTFVIDLKNVG